jgi:hypothetical protein
MPPPRNLGAKLFIIPEVWGFARPAYLCAWGWKVKSEEGGRMDRAGGASTYRWLQNRHKCGASVGVLVVGKHLVSAFGDWRDQGGPRQVGRGVAR